MGKMVRRNPYHCQAVAAASARAIFHSNAYSFPLVPRFPQFFPRDFSPIFVPHIPDSKDAAYDTCRLQWRPLSAARQKWRLLCGKKHQNQKSSAWVWMSDWVSDCVTDWMTDWRECDRVSRLIAWLMHEAIDWLMPLLISDCLNVCPTLFF